MRSGIKRTIADLEALPEDGRRYELIEEELSVSAPPHWSHQRACLTSALGAWSMSLSIVNIAPGVIFGEEDAVASDVIWANREQLEILDAQTGKLRAAPDLSIEALSPGQENERQDWRM